MAMRAPDLTGAKHLDKARDEQRQPVTRNDPLIKFVLNAPKATEPLSAEGQRALERYLRTNGDSRNA
jgi:hypothetical protein